ncbi:MAG: glycosyltransferase family 2 protein, partial [Candidatus Magasanikbacteria bacterium]|nr:glycosyltransferase family 2 protein [Candidatus Magasanikbacteria bacterium]
MLKSLDLTDYTKQDISKARKLCDLVLSENPVALPPLHPECLITILVPVYNESETRIKEQIQAFTKQRFAKHHFEIVFVVNNPKIKITPLEVLDANTAVINFLESKRHAVPTQVLDRSSKNHELKKGNVGEARNYGIHVVTKRYIEQQRDGIIIQVDADTIPTNI